MTKRAQGPPALCMTTPNSHHKSVGPAPSKAGPTLTKKASIVPVKLGTKNNQPAPEGELLGSAAQPLAARCRALQAAGAVDSIRMPDGSLAPCCMQHADDTTLHAASRQGMGVLIQRAVDPFCAASGAKLSVGKCQGMEVGVRQPFVGVDPGTGIPFPDTAQHPIRHLGILLSATGTEPHAAALYTQRLQTISWRVREWARQDLTYVGRCAVARQVMASCLTYHVQFVPVPADLMSRIHRRVTAFIMGQGCAREAHIKQWNESPPAAVASLPVAMGGSGQVDVRAHAAAMQARTAAALLHPRRAAWKPFMRANLRRALPGLGEAVLVQQSKLPLQSAVREGRLQQRHASYVEAFQRVGIHRHLAHDAMSCQQLRLELLVGNHSVGSSTDGAMLPAAGSLPAQLNRGAGTTLGQVEQLLTGQPIQDGVVLPPAWRLKLQDGSAGSWQMDLQQQWVQQEGDDGIKLHRVQQNGSLEVAGAGVLAPQNLQWVPCCVVDVSLVLHPSFLFFFFFFWKCSVTMGGTMQPVVHSIKRSSGRMGQPVVTPTPRPPLCRRTIAGPCRQLREKQPRGASRA